MGSDNFPDLVPTRLTPSRKNLQTATFLRFSYRLPGLADRVAAFVEHA
jgi:hypothetical protein